MPPSPVQKALDLALGHHQAGRLEAARQAYGQIRRAEPRLFEGYHFGGVAALQLGNALEAEPLLRAAATLKPNSVLTLMCLGAAQLRLGKPRDAQTSFERCLRLEPANVEAWTNVGAARASMGNLDGARTAYEKATTLPGAGADAWSGLGTVFLLQGDPRNALDCQERALTLSPTHAKALSAKAQALQQLNRIPEAVAAFDEHLRIHPRDTEAASQRLLLLNYLEGLDAAALFQEHKAFGALAHTQVAPISLRARPPRERLRVAFLSPDFRTHSVAYFIEPILRHLDRDRFELFLYHDHFNVDATSLRLKSLANTWRNFVGQEARSVSHQILSDAPDILVDLAGHTGHNRLSLLAQRHAPVQVAYLGYPNTTGLQTMDYRFTDAWADPTESDQYHTERLVRFAPCAWTYSPPEEAPAPLPRKREQITFGSFNALSKVGDGTLGLWRRVIDCVPGSMLLLKSSGMDTGAWHGRLTSVGFRPEQFRLMGAMPSVREHLAAYHHVDIALDPFPYNGTTTTCEALWMGLPVITLAGERHASRVGASLLHAIGRPEWIAYSPEEYIEKAVDLANATSRLDAHRTRARDALRASTLMDHSGCARDFGEALVACWTQKQGMNR